MRTPNAQIRERMDLAVKLLGTIGQADTQAMLGAFYASGVDLSYDQVRTLMAKLVREKRVTAKKFGRTEVYAVAGSGPKTQPDSNTAGRSSYPEGEPWADTRERELQAEASMRRFEQNRRK